jgi:hypothetical protein
MTDSLNDIQAINILINMLSFQEMSERQIRAYGRLGGDKLDGCLYTENFKRHWINKELDRDVAAVLNDYFLLYPPFATYDGPELGDAVCPLRTYAGTSRKKPKAMAPLDNVLIGQGYAVKNLF